MFGRESIPSPLQNPNDRSTSERNVFFVKYKLLTLACLAKVLSSNLASLPRPPVSINLANDIIL